MMILSYLGKFNMLNGTSDKRILGKHLNKQSTLNCIKLSTTHTIQCHLISVGKIAQNYLLNYNLGIDQNQLYNR